MLVQEKQKFMPRSLCYQGALLVSSTALVTSKKRVWTSVRTDPAQIHTAGMYFPKLDPFCQRLATFCFPAIWRWQKLVCVES